MVGPEHFYFKNNTRELIKEENLSLIKQSFLRKSRSQLHYQN
jgi:hypothetical protein